MSHTQLYTRDAYGSTYANPSSPDYTVRFKTQKSAKTINGVRVTNFVTEIIVNDLVGVDIKGTSAVDNVAIRLRVSGTAESHTRMKTVLKALAAQIPNWCDENTFLGFEPKTLPSVVTD